MALGTHAVPVCGDAVFPVMTPLDGLFEAP